MDQAHGFVFHSTHCTDQPYNQHGCEHVQLLVYYFIVVVKNFHKCNQVIKENFFNQNHL